MLRYIRAGVAELQQGQACDCYHSIPEPTVTPFPCHAATQAPGRRRASGAGEFFLWTKRSMCVLMGFDGLGRWVPALAVAWLAANQEPHMTPIAPHGHERLPNSFLNKTGGTAAVRWNPGCSGQTGGIRTPWRATHALLGRGRLESIPE